MLRQLIDQMLHVLCKAQKLRPQKSQWIGKELEWMIYEREVMLREINTVRLRRGCPEVTMEQVKRIEGCASGHIDYTRKFALYSAELALE